MTHQYKDILKHAIVYGVTGMLGKAVGFLLLPMYTRYITPAEYGIIEVLDVFASAMVTLIGMGISMSVFKFYYSYDSEKEKKQVISTAIIFTVFVSFTFMFVGLLNLELLSKILFKSNAYAGYIKIILLTFALSNLNNIVLVFIRAKQKSLLYTIVSFVRLFLGLGLNIYFVAFKGLGILGILYSGLIMSSVVFVVLMFYVIRAVGIRFSLQKIKEMLRYGLPLVPSSIGMFIIHLGDRFFLQRFSDLNQLGLYSVGYKLGFALNLLLVLPFSLVWDAKMFEIEKQADAKQIYKRVFTYFVFVLMFGFTYITILIKDVMAIAVSEEFFEAYKIVPLIAFAYVLNGSCYILRMGLYLRKKTEYCGIIMAITTVFTLTMYYLLIPNMGAMGAAVATLLSFAFWNVLSYVIGQRVYEIRYEWGRIIKLCFASFLTIFLSRLIYFDNYQVNLVCKNIIALSFPIVLIVLYFYQQQELELVKRVSSKIGRTLRLS